MRQALYPVPSVPVPSPAPAPFEEVRLVLPGGETAIGWHSPRRAASASAPAGLFFHGNGENLETMRLAGLFDELARFDLHLFAVDYPGYGRSGGEPSEDSLAAAAEASWAWLGQRHPAAPKLVVGWSLGAAVAVRLAASHPGEVEGLVALSPWTRLSEAAQVHFPSWLVRLFVRERYDSLGLAARVRCPALVVHGVRDSLIPAEQGQRLASSLGGKCRWVAVPGVGHNDLLASRATWEAIGSFLEELRAGE